MDSIYQAFPLAIHRTYYQEAGDSKNSHQRFWISNCTTTFRSIVPKICRDPLNILRISNANFWRIWWRIERKTTVVREIQNKVTKSHGIFLRAESGEICRNVTLSSRFFSFSIYLMCYPYWYIPIFCRHLLNDRKNLSSKFCVLNWSFSSSRHKLFTFWCR